MFSDRVVIKSKNGSSTLVAYLQHWWWTQVRGKSLVTRSTFVYLDRTLVIDALRPGDLAKYQRKNQTKLHFSLEGRAG